MLALLGGGAGGFSLVGVAHHFTGADIAGAAVWNPASLSHVASTVVLPTIVVAVSVALGLVSIRPGRLGESTARNGQWPVLAYSLDDQTGASRPGGEGNAGERPPVRAVDRFYCVTFADERGFRLWTERVVEFTSALQDLVPELLDMRPVIFVPLRPTRGAPLYAYVSPGARGLAAHISGGAKVDPTPVASSELPPGLTMLFGDGVDAAEYATRHA